MLGKIILLLSFFISIQIIVFVSIGVQAENAPVVEPKKQTLSFEDELIEGSTQKPELFYLFQKKNFNMKRLIRYRENFIPEMRRSSEDIHRQRRKN